MHGYGEGCKEHEREILDLHRNTNWNKNNSENQVLLYHPLRHKRVDSNMQVPFSIWHFRKSKQRMLLCPNWLRELFDCPRAKYIFFLCNGSSLNSNADICMGKQYIRFSLLVFGSRQIEPYQSPKQGRWRCLSQSSG